LDANRKASRGFHYAFKNRRPILSLRTPEQVSTNRAKNFNKENVDSFFRNHKTVFRTPYSLSRIWNIDETGVPTVPIKVIKALSKRGGGVFSPKSTRNPFS